MKIRVFLTYPIFWIILPCTSINHSYFYFTAFLFIDMKIILQSKFTYYHLYYYIFANLGIPQNNSNFPILFVLQHNTILLKSFDTINSIYTAHKYKCIISVVIVIVLFTLSSVTRISQLKILH